MSTDPSAAPVRERGLHSRAGNAMQRTRAAVLDGAVRAVEKHGARRTTMADIAMLAGVAKGTLYNHFRTKDAVYSATVDAAIRTLGEECVTVAREDLAEALALAAERIGASAALRRVAAEEPAVLAALVSVGADGAWVSARRAVREALAAADANADAAAVDLVLRWLLSFVSAPGHDVEAQAKIIAAAAAVSPATAAAAAVPAGSVDTSN
jgi:AcrR family transcriptional regulator